MQVFSRLESTLYTILKTKVNKAMKDKYPSISFANEPSSVTPSFPNVFFQQLQPVEIGISLDSNKINGLNDTIQITVTTNTSKAEAKTVAWACVDAVKSIRYNIVGAPLYDVQLKGSDRIHSYVLRARRLIGSGDVL